MQAHARAAAAASLPLTAVVSASLFPGSVGKHNNGPADVCRYDRIRATQARESLGQRIARARCGDTPVIFSVVAREVNHRSGRLLGDGLVLDSVF